MLCSGEGIKRAPGLSQARANFQPHSDMPSAVAETFWTVCSHISMGKIHPGFAKIDSKMKSLTFLMIVWLLQDGGIFQGPYCDGDKMASSAGESKMMSSHNANNLSIRTSLWDTRKTMRWVRSSTSRSKA